ncbi:preprotein translocase subunit Sec61beta [Candidatus Bathyarchaeota archaeon]|nr:preprotein translocase subunit Sec61beta [Candidatus Bathyarchaeota archaeon]
MGLYTDESPGLKVDPVVVLVLSLVFIFSVVALHSKLPESPMTARAGGVEGRVLTTVTVIAKVTRKWSS